MEAPESVGFVIALPQECRSLTKQHINRHDTLLLSPGVLVTVSGAGATNAEIAADTLLSRGAKRLVSWGCAGALAGHLAPGDVVIPRAARSSDGTVLSFCANWRTQLLQTLDTAMPLDQGDIAESTEIVGSVAAKRAMRDATAAVAVDMESARVLRVATHRKVPCIAVRAIADTAAAPLPASVLRAMSPFGDVELARLLLELVKNPYELVALLELHRCFRAALNNLRSVAAIAGPSLAA